MLETNFKKRILKLCQAVSFSFDLIDFKAWYQRYPNATTEENLTTFYREYPQIIPPPPPPKEPTEKELKKLHKEFEHTAMDDAFSLAKLQDNAKALLLLVPRGWHFHTIKKLKAKEIPYRVAVHHRTSPRGRHIKDRFQLTIYARIEEGMRIADELRTEGIPVRFGGLKFPYQKFIVPRLVLV